MGLFCFEKKEERNTGERDCIAACVAEIALEAALTGWQQEVASMINEHLVCKVPNT